MAFSYEDDNASMNENHTKKIRHGKARPRRETTEDRGRGLRVAERPSDWIPDDDAGEATRDYWSHDSKHSLGGRPRERPKRRGRRRRSLLSDRNGRAVAIAVITTPHVTSHRAAYACARMAQHNKRKNITKN